MANEKIILITIFVLFCLSSSVAGETVNITTTNGTRGISYGGNLTEGMEKALGLNPGIGPAPATATGHTAAATISYGTARYSNGAITIKKVTRDGVALPIGYGSGNLYLLTSGGLSFEELKNQNPGLEGFLLSEFGIEDLSYYKKIDGTLLFPT